MIFAHLVLMQLLIGDPESIRQTGHGDSKSKPPHTDSRTDVVIDGSAARQSPFRCRLGDAAILGHERTISSTNEASLS
jgi:hypothetical protein